MPAAQPSVAAQPNVLHTLTVRSKELSPTLFPVTRTGGGQRPGGPGHQDRHHGLPGQPGGSRHLHSQRGGGGGAAHRGGAGTGCMHACALGAVGRQCCPAEMGALFLLGPKPLRVSLADSHPATIGCTRLSLACRPFGRRCRCGMRTWRSRGTRRRRPQRRCRRWALDWWGWRGRRSPRWCRCGGIARPW